MTEHPMTAADAVITAVAQAADGILALINSRPSTPTHDDIAGIIADQMPAIIGAVRGEPAESNDAEGAEPCTFEPIPASFDESNIEFANRCLPWVRMAFASMLQYDHVGATDFVRKAIDVKLEEGEEDLLTQMDTQWEHLCGKFQALSEFMSIARARLLVARAYIKEERGDALINSRPQSPTKAEVVALLSRQMPAPEQPQCQTQSTIAMHRGEWRRLLDDWLAKVAISGDMRGDAPGEKEAAAASDAALEAIHEFEDDLCALRATSWPDVVMLADILLRNKFDLFDRPNTNGLYDADFEATLEAGAVCQGEAVDDVIAALLRGIRDVTLAQAGVGPWRRLDQHRMVRDLS